MMAVGLMLTLAETVVPALHAEWGLAGRGALVTLAMVYLAVGPVGSRLRARTRFVVVALVIAVLVVLAIVGGVWVVASFAHVPWGVGLIGTLQTTLSVSLAWVFEAELREHAAAAREERVSE